jgi:hypothetical protein
MHAVARFLLLLFLGASLVIASPAVGVRHDEPARRGLFATRTGRTVDTNLEVELPRTNADRLARGLTPLAPKRLHNPTRAYDQEPLSRRWKLTGILGTRREGASPSPAMFVHGCIRMREDHHSFYHTALAASLYTHPERSEATSRPPPRPLV